MILLACWCALRFGELTELRRGDLDLRHARVRVTRGVTWIDGKPTIGALRSPILASVMLRSRRTSCPLSGGTCKIMLAGARARYSFRPPMVGKSGRGGAFRKYWERARKAAGRDDLRFHDLRHTGAVLTAQSGATIAELMGRLGHATWPWRFGTSTSR
jgi:integrase